MDSTWGTDSSSPDDKGKSSRRKAKRKEDPLYTLLIYLIEKIMEEEVSSPFLEPIKESFAPGRNFMH